jgi:hypothetical protein
MEADSLPLYADVIARSASDEAIFILDQIVSAATAMI